MRLPDETRDLLCCPACRADLSFAGEKVVCTDPDCGRVYPTVDGVPILINEGNSIFSLETFLAKRPTYFPPVGRVRGWLSRMLPTLDKNLVAHRNFERLRDELKARRSKSRILVIGGGILGEGMKCLLDDPAIELIETDVSVALAPN